jgi:hypothetical protein
LKPAFGLLFVSFASIVSLPPPPLIVTGATDVQLETLKLFALAPPLGVNVSRLPKPMLPAPDREMDANPSPVLVKSPIEWIASGS